MAENTSKAEQQQVKGCTGDCKLCSMMQRGYCASQIGYNNMKLISALFGMVSELQSEIKALNQNNNTEELINPSQGK